MVKELVNMNEEEYVVFYRVEEDGTLHYLSKKKGKFYETTITLEEMHILIQKGGNIKTGKEWLINTLPGEHEISVRGAAITNYRGSCQGCCDGCEPHCYAINGAMQYHNTVLPSVIQNLVLYRLDPKRFEAELDAELSKWKADEKVFRWHASGEVEFYEYLEMMMRIAEKHPEIHFYSYTKRFKMIEQYLDAHGNFPTNFVWNLSVWKNNLVESGFNMSYIDKVQRFEWKDNMSVEDYNHSIHCRSIIHDGKKKGHLDHDMNCRKCGLCWKGKCKGKTIYVFNH